MPSRPTMPRFVYHAGEITRRASKHSRDLTIKKAGDSWAWWYITPMEVQHYYAPSFEYMWKQKKHVRTWRDVTEMGPEGQVYPFGNLVEEALEAQGIKFGSIEELEESISVLWVTTYGGIKRWLYKAKGDKRGAGEVLMIAPALIPDLIVAIEDPAVHDAWILVLPYKHGNLPADAYERVYPE